MNYKLLIVLGLISTNVFCSFAQSYNTWSLSSGQMSVADHSLSNQQYKGFTLGIHANHEVFYKTTDQHVSWNIYDSWQYGQLVNASHSALILYAGAHIGFGSHYHWKINGFTLKAGALLDFYGSLKFQSRNVNNIASSDLQTNLLASISAAYKWEWNKWGLSLNYNINSPMLGVMFVPEMGQSYYEIITNLRTSIKDITHFSSFHNRQGINGCFYIQFILPHITLNCSFVHDNQWWQANNLIFYNHNLSGQIGFALRLATLSQLSDK